MKELFYEESSHVQNEKGEKRKYNLFRGFSLAFGALATIWTVIGIFSFFPVIFVDENVFTNILIFIIIPYVATLCPTIFFGFVKNRFNTDYDYTIVSGSIRFSKVVNSIKRKNICKFNCSDIIQIGKYASETFESYLKMPGFKRQFLSSNRQPSDGREFFYICANVQQEKKIFILDCTELFIVNILKFVNVSVLEKEFK